MAGLEFLRDELPISVGLLGCMLTTYIIFVGLSLVLPRGASLFLRLLAFLQMLALCSTPLFRALLERQGLTAEYSCVRILEELALHAARYKVFIRRMMGYIGVYIDAFLFRLICDRKNNNLTHAVSKVHDAACDRATSPSSTSWISNLGGENGPVTAWTNLPKSIDDVLGILTGPGSIRGTFGHIRYTDSHAKYEYYEKGNTGLLDNSNDNSWTGVPGASKKFWYNPIYFRTDNFFMELEHKQSRVQFPEPVAGIRFPTSLKPFLPPSVNQSFPSKKPM